MRPTDRRLLTTLAAILATGATHVIPAAETGTQTSTAEPTKASPPQATNVLRSGGFQAVAQPNSPNAEAQLRFVQGDLSQHARDMKDKLTDPQKRAALREEHRAGIVRYHPDVGRLLGIDGALETKLIDLLADQQLRRLDEMFAIEEQSPTLAARIQERADSHTREMEELRELLGADGLRHFEAYRETASERARVAHFEQALPARDRLSDVAREQTIDVLRREREEHIARLQSGGSPFAGNLPLQLHDQSAMARLSAVANWRSLRELEETSARTLARLKPILTTRQFDAYSGIEAAKIAAQRQQVAQMLEDAGVSETELNSSDAVAAPPRKPAAGRMSFDLIVQVNGLDSKFPNVLVDNGGVAEVEVADGLSIEATPTLFDDGWLDVKLRFFEGKGTERRALPGGSGSGHALRLPDGSTQDAAISSTVVQGRKGYAVIVNMKNVRIKT